jgi:hypothetical protein
MMRLALGFGIVLAQIGCGAPEKPIPEGLVPVTATVTLDGKPVGGANVSLMPTGGQGMYAGGVTDENGVIEFHTADGQAKGAMPGDYQVVVSRLVMPDGSTAVPTGDKSPLQLEIEGAKESLPKPYTDMATSKLKTTVPADGGPLEIKLSSSGQ